MTMHRLALLACLALLGCDEKDKKTEPKPEPVAETAKAAEPPAPPKPSIKPDEAKANARLALTSTVSLIETAQFDMRESLKKLPKASQARAQAAFDVLDTKKLALTALLVPLDSAKEVEPILALSDQISRLAEESRQALGEANAAFETK